MDTQNGRHGKQQPTEMDLPSKFSALAVAARDRSPVSGWTHNFYRYPARFSPQFAATAIACFSKPGDLILDPYMGGGTTVVEGVAAGRQVVGNDLNSLAAFVAKVKVTPLTVSEVRAIQKWTSQDVPRLSYYDARERLMQFVDVEKTRNLSLPRARFIKKIVAAGLASITLLPTAATRDFARCVVLRVAQWALDGRVRHTPLTEFRAKLASTSSQMIASLSEFAVRAKTAGGTATILNGDAAELVDSPAFGRRKKAKLVVTSPPYPGIHVLYHRWQVDGRKETPAPYWIAGCNDGQGASYYNFADRRKNAIDVYFRESLRTLKSIRKVLRTGAHMVQLVAFNEPDEQLRRYAENMHAAGFLEMPESAHGRIWRSVPNRKWHACLKGKTHSSNEVVLIHRAV